MTPLFQHPIGKLFPHMSDEEFETLKDSIRQTGFNNQEPPVLFEGMVLDGWHRYSAGMDLGIEVPTINFDARLGLTPLQLVVQRNLNRRHLTTSQKAAVAADLALTANLQSGDKPTIAQAAEAMGVSERSVATAAALKKEDPEGFEEVKKGQESLNAASKKAEEKKEARARRDKAFNEALKIIDRELGDGFSVTVQQKLSAKEIIKLSGIDGDEMRRIKPLIEAGYKVDAALAYVPRALTPADNIRALLDRCVAQGGRFQWEHEDFVVEVVKGTPA
jgi:hypothetical protein